MRLGSVPWWRILIMMMSIRKHNWEIIYRLVPCESTNSIIRVTPNEISFAIAKMRNGRSMVRVIFQLEYRFPRSYFWSNADCSDKTDILSSWRSILSLSTTWAVRNELRLFGTMKMTKTCFIILSVLACSNVFELFSIGEVVSRLKISPKTIKCSVRISILYLQTANTLEVKSIKCSHNKQYMSSWKCEAKSLNRTMKVLNLYGTLIKRISDPEVSAYVRSMDNTV